MERYPKRVSKLCTEKILKQMYDCFYQIINHEVNNGIGFFCNIKHKNKNIPLFITKAQIINNVYYKSISILKNKIIKKIEVSDTIYINPEIDLTIIQLKENQIEEFNFMEIDEALYEKDSEICYINESIYIMNYNNDMSVSYGFISNIIDSEIIHYSNNNSKGALIFNLDNNKIIGLHTNNSLYYNKGIFFKYFINEFNKNFGKKMVVQNEVNILMKIEKESELNQEIYFLDNYEYDDSEGMKHLHDNLKELNEKNTKLYINNIATKYKKCFKPDKLGEYNINLKFTTNIRDYSYMFAGCNNIINIDFITFHSKYGSNMKYMFYKCENLKNINLFNFNTESVIDMNNMFSGRNNLEYLDLSSFNIKKVKNKDNMFNNCQKLKNIKLYNYSIKLVKDIDNNYSKDNYLTKIINDEELLFNDKINKIGSGFSKKRNIVITNKAIYNLKKKGK